ncbi:hypothetical protein TVAG_489550 [Trichomonas vaginalis G3]|uniref:DUF3447 domain-containing protein n=1 Tax=Trichomonas vaginalis (strain ATCC PRA-98 / G3) TaxID=412133 RepID=A2FEJ1_TRIV3|nr:spectrin binding [Trichomonas vaginalis G3]EAX96673.1 hypothetical protein TVAG_489550 [Trichomonas vaginalis G3]KAI5501842.1 spectrin binding [Trichomonas vaginalis G3]|eukprot:XP_001309603.1 hypothetical protein [Trichomonas vaginalis G3]
MCEGDFSIAELFELYKDYNDVFKSLYRLNTYNEDEIDKIYTDIKTKLIETNLRSPKYIIENSINAAVVYNNRYLMSYFRIFEKIKEDYHLENIERIIPGLDKLVYEKYGFCYNPKKRFKHISFDYLDKNSIYKSIMDDDIKSFISFTETTDFDINQVIYDFLNPRVMYYENTYSYLELCCYYGAARCFKFLRTKFNAEINENCLNYSFLGGNPEIMSECLKVVQPNANTMRYAIISHNIDFVSFLVNEYNLPVDSHYYYDYDNLEAFFITLDHDKNFKERLCDAMHFRIPSLCKYFILHGADLNQRDHFCNDGGYPIHLAVQYNMKEIVELLLSHHVSIECETLIKVVKPIEIAVDEKNIEIIELLLSYGAKPTAKSLDLAIYRNSKEIVEILISHGANVNEELHRFNMLSSAVFRGHKEIAELLISHGADIDKQNKNGDSALQLAAQENKPEIIDLLISHGAKFDGIDHNGNNVLFYAAKYNDLERVKLYISHGIDINAKINGQTALFAAVQGNGFEVAELLISSGANVNERDASMNTPLHFAAKLHSSDITHLLISHGADIDAVNNLGQTPVSKAIADVLSDIDLIL